jgi:hypothetical protein
VQHLHTAAATCAIKSLIALNHNFCALNSFEMYKERKAAAPQWLFKNSRTAQWQPVLQQPVA